MAKYATRGFLPLMALCALSLVPSVVSIAQADDKVAEISGDLKKVQGEWLSKDDQGESTWSFKGNKLSLKTPTRAYEISIKLEAEAKPEKTIDFHVSDTSPDAKGTKAEGIYKFDGEKLLICFGGQEAGRPKEFKMDFPNAFLYELKKK